MTKFVCPGGRFLGMTKYNSPRLHSLASAYLPSVSYFSQRLSIKDIP